MEDKGFYCMISLINKTTKSQKNRLLPELWLGEGKLKESGPMIQTSSVKINKYKGYNAECDG